jgi:hypothetical protein
MRNKKEIQQDYQEEEEMEQILMSAPIEKEETSEFEPTEGDEHSKEWLKIFSQETEQEMTAALEPTAEEEADNIEFADLYEELEALEKRVIVQSLHIQQIKLETSRGAYQPQEQLEEVGLEPTQGEVAEANLSEEVTKKQFSQEKNAGWK